MLGTDLLAEYLEERYMQIPYIDVSGGRWVWLKEEFNLTNYAQLEKTAVVEDLYSWPNTGLVAEFLVYADSRATGTGVSYLTPVRDEWDVRAVCFLDMDDKLEFVGWWYTDCKE